MRLITLFIVLCSFQVGIAQTPPPDDLFGVDMQDWLWENYYDGKHITFDYDDARLHLYRTIDNQDERIRCVYSGFERDWRSNSNSNNPFPINCEHTIPRSFFDEEYPMFSDFHHLFPTYRDWNSERSNYRFSEIADDFTELWMYLDEGQTSIPTEDIDLYSEGRGNSYSNGRFEPREDHKGNLARAIFYFYTMYPDVGEITEVVSNVNTLCNWHNQDRVIEQERIRNNRIEALQGDRNPYVDFPEVAEAAWGCPPYSSIAELNTPLVRVFPNPTAETLHLEVPSVQPFQVRIFDARGYLVKEQQASTGESINVQNLAKGIYVIQLHFEDSVGHQRFVKE